MGRQGRMRVVIRCVVALQAAARNGGAEGAGHAVLPLVEIILAGEDQHIPNFYGNITSARPCSNLT